MRGSKFRRQKTEHGRRRGNPSSVIRYLSKSKPRKDTIEQGLAISLLALGVVLRLIPHPPNFAPISAIALFGGAHLAKPYALVLPLLAMFASDMIGDALGLFPGFHRTQPAVYLSFFLVGLIGLWLRNHRSTATIVGGALTASILFFLITNFAVWYGGTMYPQNWQGLVTAYVAGIPFFRNTLLGDLTYTAVLFGAYELTRMTVVRLSTRAVAQRQ